MKNEQIELLRPDKRRGPLMPRYKYDLVCECVFQTLGLRKKISFSELLESVRTNLSENFVGDTSWYVLQVKLDLEARGLITISMERDRVQVIELKKGSWKKRGMTAGRLNSTRAYVNTSSK